jgi:hypothetical protein
VTLSVKHQAFVESLFTHNMNATQAYLYVYGGDRVAAASNGARLIRNDKVAEAIKVRLNENAMSADEVLSRMADIARGDMSDLMALSTSGFTFELLIDDGNGKKIPNPKTKLIKKIKQRVTTFLGKSESDEDREIIETELELYSAHDALRDLGKFHKLFVDRQEITGKDGAPLVTRVEVVLPAEDNGNTD